jgi:fluoroacetyl-CoA thioesterase
MSAITDLTPGLTGQTSVRVEEKHLATSVGSGQVAVYASPMMIALMEAACVECVERRLPRGYLTLGMHIDVTHTAPTPIGATVTATAELMKIDGRKLIFRIAAHDGIDTIGGGTHTRVIVDEVRFEARLAIKRPA